MIKISFVGDIVPGGVLTFTGGVSQEVLNILAASDLRVATLECAFGDGTTLCPLKMSDSKRGANIIYAPDEMVSLLKKLQIDIVSLANNHISDLGVSGIKHTIDILRQNGIDCLGAGMDEEEASRPLVKTINDKTCCFLAYCEPNMRFVYCAEACKPGMNGLTTDKVVADIRRYRTQYDYVFVIPHFGKEHTHWPELRVMQMCKLFISAGATGVIGSHTHYVQPTYMYKRSIISPSLGNFIFPDRYIDAPRITVYPSKEERDNTKIPVVYNYPIVNILTLKKVRTKARVGVILEVDIDREISYSRRLTILTSNNLIDIYHNDRFERKLKWIAFITQKKILYKSKLYVSRLLSKLKIATSKK